MTATIISHNITRFEYLSKSNRNRREPAIWGEPAGDYSIVVLEDRHIYIHALLFVDSKISNYYNNDTQKMNDEILMMIKESNEYFFQLNIHIIVVGIIETGRNDLSLYTFESYRLSHLHKYPKHDFATLITYRYAGGLAFVNGLCQNRPIMLCGFYPQKPEAMGSIYFHEFAHLLGLPHLEPNKSLIVPNCRCDEFKKEGQFEKKNCLKIPGYDHECTVQSMINHAYKAYCIDYKEPAVDLSQVMAVCGNGLVESSETCDCGTKKTCIDFNCNPNTCRRYIQVQYVFAFVLMSFVLLLCLAIMCAAKIYPQKMKDTLHPKSFAIRNFDFKCMQAHDIFQNNDYTHNKIDAYGIRRTLSMRPKYPPPAPPLLINNYKMYKEFISSDYSAGTSVTTLETMAESPVFNFIEDKKKFNNEKEIDDKEDHLYKQNERISWKFDDFESDEDVDELSGLQYSIPHTDL
uniref:Peptidase M12B domain-containing protein n=1 Tax=Rhabditophanes sp. KR3021 TaxID=114890 RepID=A0AC35TVP3_9BILA